MPHDPSDALVSERLRLRRWRKSDIEAFAALNADPEVMEHFPGCLSRVQSRDRLARIEQHFEQHGFGLWAVEVLGGAECIGFTGLDVPTFEAPCMPCVEVGWRLARAHWGQGYASEAARAALALGFEELDLAEIVSFTSPRNQRSVRVMERLGMTRDPEADFEHPVLPVGHPLRPHLLYRLQRADWQRRR